MRSLIHRMIGGIAAAGVLAGAWGVTHPSAAAAAAAPGDCAGLAALSLEHVAITSATPVSADAQVPAHCRVLGTLEGTIRFQVALPIEHWNGKFFFAGGGGFNGTIPNLNQALARNYAAAGSDTGHQGESSDASWALNNPKAQLDYAHRATHLVTDVGKQIVRAFYDHPEQRAYFVGCSNGGKMGLMEMLRYPNDFDGVVIGNFVTDRTRLMMDYTWNAQALAAAPIPPAKIPLLAKATLAACDARDGLTDQLIDRPDRCGVDIKRLTCTGADGPDCLTAGQVGAIEKIWSGPKTPDGRAIFPGFLPGHEEDYPQFLTGDGTRDGYPSSTWKLQDGFMRFFAFGASFNSVTAFDFGSSPASLAPLSADQDAGAPALEAFKAHGGKLIMYHGWADHSIPPTSTLEFYGKLRQRFDDADQFTRLFMVPGLHHCVAGPGPNVFGGANQGLAAVDDTDHDIVRALDAWVEHGTAPERIVATKFTNDDRRQGVQRTRPLCRYPQMATYKGSGSVDDAGNFACALPK